MSPKNKGNFGKGKPAIEPDDEFVSGVSQLSDRLRPYAGLIIASVAGLFVVSGIWVGYQHLQDRAAAKASWIYDEALTLSQRTVNPFLEETERDAQDAAGAGEFPSYEARAAAVLAKLEELQAAHGSTPAAKSARLLQARMLYDLGRYQEAATAYETYLASAPVPGLQWVARVGLGYAREAMAMGTGDASARQTALQQALETFRQIQSKDDGPQRDYALYHEARILAMLDQKSEASAALHKALEVAPESLLTNDIKLRLAQLEASAKE